MTGRRNSALLLLTGLFLLAARPVPAVVVGKEPSPEEIQDMIKRFAAKETEFAVARENYIYRQTNKIIEVDENGTPGGRYEMVAEVTFNDRNRRVEKVLRAPMATLQNIQMSPEDEQDMRNVLPFVLTTESLEQYNVRYLGREQVDEIGCFMFAVKPKTLTKDRKRYFEGQIWVDDRDYQIVKTYGRSTGYLRKHEDQQFPKFETYREQIDGKFWFPTYTYADDVLNFEQSSQRIKVIIKYDQYKKYEFKSESTIQYGDPGDSDSKQPAPPANNPPPAPPPAKK